MMLEGRRRGGHFQGNFLLPSVLIMRVFSITESAPMVGKRLIWDAPFRLR